MPSRSMPADLSRHRAALPCPAPAALPGALPLFATAAAGPLGARDHLGWAEAARQRLCLLSEDMQNRRILDAVFKAQGAEVHPNVVSNSFLGVLSQLRAGAWSSIVPHTFAHLFGAQPISRLIPLIDPVHTQSVGLVTTNRDPPPPMARALESAARRLDLRSRLEPMIEFA
ncbi:MAG: LysR family transcriptional regulator substrate-binding protein [Aliidongia sp.]